MALSITSANAQFLLSIPLLIPVPVPLQGWAADDAFSVEAFDVADAIMGVDGRMAAGYTPNVKKINLVFQANSPSLDIMDQWIGAMESSKDVLACNGVIVMPSIARIFTLTNGVLTQARKLPDAKKMLQPVPYQITFENIQPALA